MYKGGQSITDCRSGVCHKAKLWFNGYIAPGVINAASKGVSGLPSDYVANQADSPAYSRPIDTDITTTNYNTNYVDVTLANGTTTKVAFSPGPAGTHPYGHTYLNGPYNWTTDLSLFKVFPITEKTNLRFNIDAFNALNVQGYNNPDSTTGIEQIEPGTGVASSYNTPRQVQFTLRYTF
jgi:hypothetical protein